MDKILLVEDADSLREVLTSVLEQEGYTVDAFATAEEAAKASTRSTYVCVLSDFRLPGMHGIDLLKNVRENSKTVPFLLMTAYGSIDIAVEAMKHGANDFVTKPLEPKHLCSVIDDIIEHRRIINRNTGRGTRRERSFLSLDPATNKLLGQARKVATVDSSVLLLGESGTGKELMARYIHEHSPRRDEPFVAINCGAMPPDLLESEFFGHESGAFTGATQRRIGTFEYAANGTIFLDEVGDMPARLQVKLLRALQEREITRVGSNKTIKVNPRVIAATNRDVEADLDNKSMREDFYYRLAVITFTIPPLRERASDIGLLADYYIEYFCAKNGKKLLALDDGARNLLKSYSWPGNARELENVIERAVILAAETITLDHLGIELHSDAETIEKAQLTLPEIAGYAARKAEIKLITNVLQKTEGNKTKAAQILGVSYKTLLNKVKDYKL